MAISKFNIYYVRLFTNNISYENLYKKFGAILDN